MLIFMIGLTKKYNSKWYQEKIILNFENKFIIMIIWCIAYWLLLYSIDLLIYFIYSLWLQGIKYKKWVIYIYYIFCMFMIHLSNCLHSI